MGTPEGVHAPYPAGTAGQPAAPMPPAAPMVAVGPAAGSQPGVMTGLTLGAATVFMGLMAGLFWGFDISVMPGLGDANDITFVTAMQNINSSIENMIFGLVFVGSLLLPAGAAIALLTQKRIGAAVWTALAAGAYLLVLILTMGVNVPLNEELARAGNPTKIKDIHQVREDFEMVWNISNHARTFLCIVAMAFLTRAMVLYGTGQAMLRRSRGL